MCVHNDVEYSEDILEELQDLRSAELKPVLKFLRNTIPQQFRHIQSKIKEVEIEIINFWRFDKFNLEKAESARLHAGEELTDLINTCITMLAILGFDEHRRRDLCRKIIAKNEEINYYKNEQREW